MSAFRRRKDLRLLGAQFALHDRLGQGWAGKRRTRDQVGRHVGRPCRRDFRRTARNQQSYRGAMLIGEPFGSMGVGHARFE